MLIKMILKIFIIYVLTAVYYAYNFMIYPSKQYSSDGYINLSILIYSSSI